MFRYYEERIPQDASVLVVSNHRSFMDAPVLMEALSNPIRFACHHYMGQVPIMRSYCYPTIGLLSFRKSRKPAA
ncbi:1-acyl-sn-glycerol-3-phosphate acyltransferase [Plectonema radiosum]|uniref:1-acyl-sn-glycerol-3-phosphate acyltransferase n=1 Tax=Plectonema radiosum TaxID=945768 RepID=UPI002980BAB3|nr:1-acyl-sn-glycerol-3-phosphate acyltransferase [Plectonema radiosum]